MHMHNDTGGIM